MEPWITAEMCAVESTGCSLLSYFYIFERIKAAKCTYAGKLQERVCETRNSRPMWQGIQALTDRQDQAGGWGKWSFSSRQAQQRFAWFEVPTSTIRERAGLSPPFDPIQYQLQNSQFSYVWTSSCYNNPYSDKVFWMTCQTTHRITNWG